VDVRIGVVDVGSNTIRLLLAQVEGREVVPLEKERVRLSLGAEIERTGVVSDVSIAAAAKAVEKLCGVARRGGAETLDVFLTAPGRQSANAEHLVDAITRSARHSVRILSTEEEGRLAYAGAVATADVSLPDEIAVCDVGGASTEIAVGDPNEEPSWVESIDLGSVRLTARIDDPEARRAEVAHAFAAVVPPAVRTALAVGGSARAARRLVGPSLGEAELAEALRIVATKREETISRRYGVHRTRARILQSGLVLLAEVQGRLGVPLHVCDGGIREGAVLATVAELAA
jgi:exopolyphosphatase / guanosine-5'-triphosphate,3'-diphosphate pyrophosphatase